MIWGGKTTVPVCTCPMLGEQQVLHTGGHDHIGQWYIVTEALSLIKKFM